MAFDNQVFPIELSALGVRSTWEDTIVKLGGGSEQRAVLWTDALRYYDASTPTLTIVNLNLILKHFNGRRGRGRAFPVRDRSSFQAATEAVGTAGGIGTTMQLTINQGDAGNAYNREIYLPESGTVTIFGNASPLVETTDYTLAYSGSTGGTLTWVTNQSGKSITWTGNYYVPVRYDTKAIDPRLFIWRTDGTGLVEGPQIPLVEVRYLSEF